MDSGKEEEFTFLNNTEDFTEYSMKEIELKQHEDPLKEETIKVEPEIEEFDQKCRNLDEAKHESNNRIVNSKRLKCEFCKYATDHTSTMKKHKQRKHLENNLIISSFVDQISIGSIQIDKFKCENDSFLFGCHVCEYKSIEKSAVKRHTLRMHSVDSLTETDSITVNEIEVKVYQSTDGSLMFGCDLCGYKATDKSTIVRHKERKHFGKPYDVERVEGGFLCDKCEFKTSVLRNLKMHMKRIHEPRPLVTDMKLQCDQCPYQGQNHRQLQRHIKEKHSTFECCQCKYRAPGPFLLTAHVNFVHLNIGVKCSLCEFQAPDRPMLEYHVQTVHERNCSELSPLLSKDEFGNLVYKCHSCNYFSSKPTHVTEHIQVEHFGVKTERLVRRQLNTAKSNQMESKCDYCDYVGKKRNVTKHMQGKHLGVKYTCDKCGWQCSDPSNLKKHIRSKHTELSKCGLEKSQPLVKPYSIAANIGEGYTASEDVKTGYKI